MLRNTKDLKNFAIRASPVYDPDAVLGRAWELRLHAHCRCLGYWPRNETPLFIFHAGIALAQEKT
jgi:hypothetical protein